MKLCAQFTLGLDAARPVNDRTVARAAPVGRDLFGPLVRRVHRVRPPHGVVSTELVDTRFEKLGRFDARYTVEYQQLVEAAVERAFGGSAVVADDIVNQRIVELL